MAEHIVNQQRGARASSDFATFPSTLFVKVRARRSRFSQSVNVSAPPTHPVPAGQGGEAGRLGAGGPGPGAVSPRAGAGPPAGPAAAPAAEDSQSAAELRGPHHHRRPPHQQQLWGSLHFTTLRTPLNMPAGWFLGPPQSEYHNTA